MAADAGQAGGEADLQAEKPRATKGSHIWLLTSGTLGDHAPCSALALGLEKAGHRVRSFGMAFCARTFTDRGLDYTSINLPLALHPANAEVQAKIRKAAAEIGLEDGPGQEEEFFLDVRCHVAEYVARRIVQIQEELNDGMFSTAAHAHGEVVGKEMMKVMKRLEKFNVLLGSKDFAETDECLQSVLDMRSQSLEMHAKEEQMELEDCKALRLKRYAVWRQFLRKKAEELGWNALDLAEVFNNQVGTRLYGFVAETANAAERMKKVKEQADLVIAFLKPDQDLDEMWNGWLTRSPTIVGSQVVTKGFEHCVFLGMSHLLFTIEALPAEERPQMCIFNAMMTSVAAMLQIKYGVRAVAAFFGKVAVKKEDLCFLYARLAYEEGKQASIPYTPIKDMGVIAFCNWLGGLRHLVALTPQRMVHQDYDPVIWRDQKQREVYRSRWTGAWMHEDAKKPLDDAWRFASPEERERLMNFLAASNQPPVCIDFGSMTHPQGCVFLGRMLVKAIMMVDRRFIILSGRSAITHGVLRHALAQEEANPTKRALLEQRICWLSHAPHDWLFLRCILLVHSGASGIMSAAMYAGVPSIVVPAGFEQNANAMWLKSMGIGIETSFMDKLTFGELGNKIRAMLNNQGMRVASREVAKAIRAETGVANAVELIEGFLQEQGDDKIVEPPGTRSPHSWLEGPWGYYFPGDQKKADLIIRGNCLMLKEGEVMVTWLRSGNFRGVRRDNPDIEETYSLEAYSPGIGFTYGNVLYDGTFVALNDGGSYRYHGVVDHDKNRKAKAAIAAWVSWAARPD